MRRFWYIAMVAGWCWSVCAAAAQEGPRLSFSGEIRERATYLSGNGFDDANPDRGWSLTQRLRFQIDAEVAPALRGRINLLSAVQTGFSDSPVDRNVLDLHEAYVEVGSEDRFVRLGRQEMRLGSQRLVGWRDGTNVRRVWDGVRGVFALGDATLDAFALQLVDVETTGAFNDTSDDDRVLAGLYWSGAAPVGNLHLYYLFAGFDDRENIEGTADERRQTLGLRSFGENGPWAWNAEAAYQFGRAGRDDIRAWTIAADISHQWRDRPLKPRLGLSANVASGDSDRGDGRLETFNALYPRGSYFSDIALLGPSNFINLRPSLQMFPRDDLLVYVDMNFFWRLDRNDGIYSPSGSLLRGPEGSDARYVNTSLSAGVEWQARDDVLFSAIYARSHPGDFIRETGPSDPIDFIELTIKFTF
ncbi:alginate export family protein [Sulfitobacter sp. S190]|uniref:alginate export family protein n=1 Tax=Sulfitobacter sp. S190 TaxID=2867022 RepID=UPI0021A3F5DC|nr:alginate export family protein [Sulfitobacter sp. S190]UWR24522.1 alginate export family protein [Sulfitobacter sp. S190]